MKIRAIAFGASVAVLAATSATAGDIAHGEWARHVNGALVTGWTNAAQDPWNNDAANRLNAQTGNLPEISAIYFLGSSSGDNGTAEGSDHAQFTLKGKVNTDCALYSGSSQSHTLDFGTLGIYASDNTGPANAFDMVDDATVSIYTNLAGCNTANNVVLSKNSVQGLVNTGNTGGFDTNVFQKNLPFKVVANYTAGTDGVEEAGSPQTLTADVGDLSATRAHGAWKSPLALHVTIPAPTASLLAGDYSGWVRVEISAQ